MRERIELACKPPPAEEPAGIKRGATEANLGADDQMPVDWSAKQPPVVAGAGMSISKPAGPSPPPPKANNAAACPKPSANIVRSGASNASLSKAEAKAARTQEREALRKIKEEELQAAAEATTREALKAAKLRANLGGASIPDAEEDI